MVILGLSFRFRLYYHYFGLMKVETFARRSHPGVLVTAVNSRVC